MAIHFFSEKFHLVLTRNWRVITFLFFYPINMSSTWRHKFYWFWLILTAYFGQFLIWSYSSLNLYNSGTGKDIKGELQRENELISYERAFKMLDNDMYIAGIGQAVLELLSFKVGSGNHQRGISLLQKFSDIFGNMRLVSLKMTSHLTSHNF